MEAENPLIRLLLAACLLFAGSALAHPLHVSEAEAEWSSDGSTLDVALRVVPEDLETALSRTTATRVTLDDSAATRNLVERYLRQHFQLRQGDRIAPLSLIGMQFERRDLWLYFSCRQSPAEDLRLRHTVLMDVVEGQHNHLRRLWDPRAGSLLFTALEPERELPVYLDNSS